MPDPRRPFPRGTALFAAVGLVLLAINLRTALAAFSSVADRVGEEIIVSTETAGLIGAAPSACFAVFGLLAPRVARTIGLERAAVLALGIVLLGHVLRSIAGQASGIVIGTLVIFAGVGVGNVLVPALIRRYHGDRINVMTGVVGFVYAVGTGVSAIATPAAAGIIGWRWALGMWGAFAVVAALPWIALAARRRPARGGGDFIPDPSPDYLAIPSVWRSPLAWALMLTFGYGAIASYSLFTWLPSILEDMAGIPVSEAGGYLALFGFMGIPINIVVIVVGARRTAQTLLMLVGIFTFMIGYAGLALLPDPGLVVLWVALIGLGPFAMQMVLVLLGERTRSPQATVALSGFVQSVGYGTGAIGPLLLGIAKDVAGGWSIPLLFLALGAIPLLLLTGLIARSGPFDEAVRR